MPVFFIGCVHTDSLAKVNTVFDDICRKVNRPDLHFDSLSRKGKKTAWTELLNSNLKLDVAITFTNDFEAMKQNFQEKETKDELFEFKETGAKYKKFDEMCQTEMLAKETWLIFAEDSNPESPNYEKPLKLLRDFKENPIIEYDPVPRINLSTWKQIHLERQLTQYQLSVEPHPIKSNGVKLADVLTSGFREYFQNHSDIGVFLKREPSQYPVLQIGEFYTDGLSIWLTRPNLVYK